MPLVAVLDTCALVPEALRNTLLWVATEGVYKPRWSSAILAELDRTLTDDLRLSRVQVDWLLRKMREEFLDSLVAGYEHRIASLTNHPDDRHVLAAAIQAAATVIVTANQRDFPESALRPFAIVTRTPDQFLSGLFETFPAAVERAVRKQAETYRDPPLSLNDVLERLRQNTPIFARSMRIHLLADQL